MQLQLQRAEAKIYYVTNILIALVYKPSSNFNCKLMLPLYFTFLLFIQTASLIMDC